jgi:hypothetical protein
MIQTRGTDAVLREWCGLNPPEITP